MKLVMLERLRQMQERLSSLDIQLSQPDVAEDLERLRTTSQARATLALPIELYQRYQHFERELAEAQTLISDPSMREMAEVEVALCREEMERLGREIQSALLPGDPADGRNVFVEVRAGTGGDESSLFAADLSRMYTRFVERRGWRLETISSSPSGIGGFKEVILRVIGEGAYAWLKFESGGHRVQRIPTTESQGRIHTSACTVAVMPEADPLQSVTIDPSDLRVDTFRASGAGGQHVNRTDSAVRLTHLPTGVVVECQDDRSQHRNKAQAMAVLLARLEERQRQERADRTAAARRSLIGSGDRSERIRTYNFPQNRVTDHRIHLTVHKIDSLMDGALDELLLALRHAYEAEQMEALEAQAAG